MANELMTNMTFLASASKSDITALNKAVDKVKKELIAYANSYVKLCKALCEFDDTGLYKLAINPETSQPYSTTKDFAKVVFGLDRSACNDSMKIFRKYFEIKDVIIVGDDGKQTVKKGQIVPKKIGEFNADEFNKTALIQLSVLSDDETKKAVEKGLKPDLTIKETKEIIDMVHAKKGKNGATNRTKGETPKKHPCNDMDVLQLVTYLTEACDGFSKSKACTVLTDGKSGSKAKLVSIFKKCTNDIEKLFRDAINTDVHENHNEPSEAVKEKLNG